MRLLAVGVNHSSARLSLRERLSIAAQDALVALRSRDVEGFVLSTCGRTELYAYAASTVDPLQLFAAVFSSPDAVPLTELAEVCYAHVREAAVRHALRVASGLDSIVLGEDQIHAQLKKALGAARAAGTLGAVTDRLGTAALSCSKRVRTSTGLSRHAVSLESLGVRAAAARTETLASRRILIIGAGDSAAIVLKHLRSLGATDVTIVSRTASRALELAQAHGVRARAAVVNAELAELLADADVVFCCTSAPHSVVTPDLLAPRLHRRAEAPLVCVDLGMPRDVHPDVTSLGVDVIGLDVLDPMAEAHRATRRQHIPAAEAVVARESATFAEWLRARATVGAVAAASAHADAVVAAELKRITTRLQGATLHDRELIAELAHRIARKLVHGAINTLRESREEHTNTMENHVS